MSSTIGNIGNFDLKMMWFSPFLDSYRLTIQCYTTGIVCAFVLQNTNLICCIKILYVIASYLNVKYTTGLKSRE